MTTINTTAQKLYILRRTALCIEQMRSCIRYGGEWHNQIPAMLEEMKEYWLQYNPYDLLDMPSNTTEQLFAGLDGVLEKKLYSVLEKALRSISAAVDIGMTAIERFSSAPRRFQELLTIPDNHDETQTQTPHETSPAV